MIIRKLDEAFNLNPNETRADLPICPYRFDWVQSECHTCNFCGRNELHEYGGESHTIEINGFLWFVDNLEKTDQCGFVQYGNKLLDFNDDDLVLYQEGGRKTLQNIADKIRTYGFFMIRDDDTKLYQLTEDKSIKEYTCTQLCDYLEGKNFHKDILELIQREDNIMTIAEYLPILY